MTKFKNGDLVRTTEGAYYTMLGENYPLASRDITDYHEGVVEDDAPDSDGDIMVRFANLGWGALQHINPDCLDLIEEPKPSLGTATVNVKAEGLAELEEGLDRIQSKIDKIHESLGQINRYYAFSNLR